MKTGFEKRAQSAEGWRVASAALILAIAGSGCSVAKVAGQAVALPFKATYQTVKFTGNGIYQAGRGLYYVGRVPVRFTAAALETTASVFLVTYRIIDTAGNVVILTSEVSAAALEAELLAARQTAGLTEIIVDVLR